MIPPTSTTAAKSTSMTLLNPSRSIGRLLVILVAMTPLKAALSSRRTTGTNIAISHRSNKASLLQNRAFVVSSNRRRFARDKRVCRVHPTAFVTHSSLGGIAASSLFYPTEKVWKRRRHSLNSHALINPNRVLSSHCGRAVRIFISESSSALHQHDQSAASASADFALDNDLSRTGIIVHSLQGGALDTNDHSLQRNNATLDQRVNSDSPNGSLIPHDAIATDNYINGENGQNDNCNSHSNNDKETNEKEKNVLIHVYPHHHNTQSNTAASIHTNNTRMDNTTLYYENAMLVGVGMSQRQFATWVHYQLATQKNYVTHSETIHITDNNIGNIGEQTTANEQTCMSPLQLSISKISNRIRTQKVDWENEWESHISTLRTFWREERLLCEYTTILSPKRLANKPLETADSNQEYTTDDRDEKERKEEEQRIIKSQHFKEALSSYAERMVGIVEDEMSDGHHVLYESVAHSMQTEQNHHVTPNDDVLPTNIPQWNTSRGLLGWIEHEYGMENTQALLADSLLSKTEEEQLEKLHSFLIWFRSKFPYYHDKCDSCGASCKVVSPMTNVDSDIDIATVGQKPDEDAIDDANADNLHVEESDGMSVDDVSFLGYVYPSFSERLGNASRTELYRCRSCDSFTRFPRYNRALWITHARRGRCGEYSMLFYRFLRAMGYEKVRWVVDWADHVWVEVWLGEKSGSAVDGVAKNGRWVHCDPCEASIDEPLLYQGWGKNQTYIVAFYDPFKNKSETAKKEGSLTDDISLQNCNIPLVEDVTSRYTRDEINVIHERRGISNEIMSDTIQQVSMRFSEMLSNHQR